MIKINPVKEKLYKTVHTYIWCALTFGAKMCRAEVFPEHSIFCLDLALLALMVQKSDESQARGDRVGERRGPAACLLTFEHNPNDQGERERGKGGGKNNKESKQASS